MQIACLQADDRAPATANVYCNRAKMLVNRHTCLKNCKLEKEFERVFPHAVKMEAEKKDREAKVTPQVQRAKCVHLGDVTEMTVPCETCTGSVDLKLFVCGIHQLCTTGKRVPGRACCDGQCKEYTPLTNPTESVKETPKIVREDKKEMP